MTEARYRPLWDLTPVELQVERMRREEKRSGQRRPAFVIDEELSGLIGPETKAELFRRASGER